MEIVDDLKRKRAELTERIRDITREQMALQGQVAALDKVIALYEPGYTPEKGASATPPRPSARVGPWFYGPTESGFGSRCNGVRSLLPSPLGSSEKRGAARRSDAPLYHTSIGSFRLQTRSQDTR
jgi:hypothetical protein